VEGILQEDLEAGPVPLVGIGGLVVSYIVYISRMYLLSLNYHSPESRQCLSSSPVGAHLWESHGEDRGRDDKVKAEGNSDLLASSVGKEVDELERITSKSEESGKPEKVVDDPQFPPEMSRPWGVGLFSG